MPSTVIRSFAYNAPSKILTIMFTSGRRYSYYDVPPAIFDSMRGASSKGEFFNQHIRDRFRYTRDLGDRFGQSH